MLKLKRNARRVLDYVLGVGLFLLALGLTSSSSWFRSHYPYLGYFVASLTTCFLVGLGPARKQVVSEATKYPRYG